MTESDITMIEEDAGIDPTRQAEVAALRRTIARGFDAAAFLASDVGQYMRLKASRELEEAQERLVLTDATNTAVVQALQLQARVAQRVLTWFADAVAEGENSEVQYRTVFEQARHPD